MGVAESACSRRTSAGSGKYSLKHSKSFRFILSNQKLARAFANTPKATAPANTSRCLATSWKKTADTTAALETVISCCIGGNVFQEINDINKYDMGYSTQA